MLLDLMIAFAAGLLIGAAYFAGLWLTVRRITGAGLAPLWLFVSAIIRLTLLVGAVLWIANGRWEMMLSAMTGILVAHLVATLSARATVSTRGAGRAQPIGAADADHA